MATAIITPGSPTPTYLDIIGLFGDVDLMLLHGTPPKPNFFSKKIFYIHLSICLILTVLGPVFFVLLPMIMWDHSFEFVLRAVTQTAEMILIWVAYLAQLFMLPFTFVLPRLQNC